MTYNLLDSSSVEQAIKNSVPCMKGQTTASVKTAMEQFHTLQTNPQFLNFDNEGKCAVSGIDWAETNPVEKILSVGNKLNVLSRYKNFKSFTQAFNNPQQFSATIFEVDCCHYFSQSYKILDFEFEVEHKVNGNIKKPEFKAVFDDNIEVFGECKSLASLNRVRSSRVMKMKESIFEKILPIIPDNRRIEISFKTLPQHWNKNYADQMSGLVGEIIKRDYMEKHFEITIAQKHTTCIKLCYRSEKQFLTNIINVGDAPPDQYPKIILGELANIKCDIKDLIKDASSQLSDDSFSVIFVYSLHKTYAAQAIAEYFKNNQLTKLLGVFSWTDILEFHRNPSCETNLEDLKVK